MSSKQLLRLAGVLAAVLVLWGAVALASRRSNEGGEQVRILPDVDTSGVDSIALTGPADTILLARMREGPARWQVNGKPADPKLVAELLGALKETRSGAELVARNPASHARLRVTEDSGTQVRVVQDGRAIINLLAGKQSAEWDGIYLRRSGEPAVYVIRGGLAPALTRPAEDWRNHTVATIIPDSVSAIEIRRGRRSYTVRRKGSGWVFGSGGAADSADVAGLLSRYREVKAAGFATAAQADSLNFGRLRRVARLLGKGGAPLLTLEFDSVGSGVWVRVQTGPSADPGSGKTAEAGEGEVYRLDSWTAEQLAPPDTALR